jgi:WXXGXW repeat (2 copies)
MQGEIMRSSKTLLGIMFAAGLIAAPTAVFAVSEIEVTVAPPAARVEVAPAPREGYVWEHGYWRWDNDARKYNWQEGRFIPNREGHHYVQHEWRSDGGKWRFRAGHWDDE